MTHQAAHGCAQLLCRLGNRMLAGVLQDTVRARKQTGCLCPHRADVRDQGAHPWPVWQHTARRKTPEDASCSLVLNANLDVGSILRSRARHARWPDGCKSPSMRCAERRCLDGVKPPTSLQPDQLVPTTLHRTDFESTTLDQSQQVSAIEQDGCLMPSVLTIIRTLKLKTSAS